MAGETMFRTMMHNSHKYTSLKLSRKVSLKLTELNPFCEYFFQNTLCKWPGMFNLNVPKNVFLGKNLI